MIIMIILFIGLVGGIIYNKKTNNYNDSGGYIAVLCGILLIIGGLSKGVSIYDDNINIQQMGVVRTAYNISKGRNELIDATMMIKVVEKNEWLKDMRGITFEDVVYHLTHGGLLDTIEHYNQKQYPGQRIFIVNIDGYACLVPFVEDEKTIFLKTIIPSRKMTKQYLGGTLM